MESIQKCIITGSLFILTIAAGIWLHHTGKPFNIIIFTLHKFAAIATTVLVVILIVNLVKKVEINHIIFVLIVLDGLAFLALYITSALLSIGKLTGNIILITHNIATILALSITAWNSYFLLKR